METTGESDYRLRAVIDVGSTSIRMVVAEVHPDGTFRVLDSLNQSVAVGHDSFQLGVITPPTVEECVQVLKNFRSVLDEYGINPKRDVRAVTTSATRDAANRDEFVDRLFMATGIHVEPIEGTEVNRLTFLAIQPLLKRYKRLRQHRLLVLEVGGGSTDLLGLESGRVAFAHTHRLGSYRLREIMDDPGKSGARQAEVLKQEIATSVAPLFETLQTGRKQKLLLLGGEVRLAARQIQPKWNEKTVATISTAELERFVSTILELDVEKIVAHYHLALEEAQTLGPALEVCLHIARGLSSKRLYIGGASLRDGLLIEAATGTAWTADFVEQVVNSARKLGRRYDTDERHTDQVAANSLAIFHALADEHRLGPRYELVLHVAALLHDIGIFINPSSHHKHSQYLIQNSDLFGIGAKETRLTALVARYHRRALPKQTHPDYAALPHDERLFVRLLAAILRVADALDRSHSRTPYRLKLQLEPQQLVIELNGLRDWETERRALAKKGELFEQVFGRRLVIRQKKKG